MSRRTIVLAVVLPVTLLVAGLGAFGALAIDRQARRTLPSSAFIQGVDVGGLRFDQAVARVREKVEAPLHRPVKLTVDEFEVDTSPWELGYRVDVPAAVRKAMGSRSSGNVVSRVASQLFGSGPAPFLELRPTWGPGRLDEVVAEAGRVVGTAPKDADIDISTGWVKMVPEKAGKEIDVDASKRAIMDGVTLGDSTVRLVARPIKPATDADLSKVILVRAGENKLYLYENGRIVKSWPVATGASGYLTPEGVWRITQKIVNPSWHNPGSAWARGLPKVIPPGPNNPLGTKALRLDAPAILIHATANRSSIGFSESHGCIRMTEEDEAELFSMVGVGTRVGVVQVAPPKPRSAAPIDATEF
ncbi:MAG TPA: L,D-transpeptidase/peptidoglycan binding protein [Acidimicrobiales bacterium]|nr:L,D-transpeptidase/peptidoglycan binding protein [Acidimicrobiales bacterium]